MLRFLCLLLLFYSASVYGETLKVVTENWRPYSYEENGVIKGKSAAIVKKVLSQAGIDYTMTIYPWSRGYLIAKTEPNVLIFSLVRIPVREKLFKWVRPLGNGDTSSLYRLKNNTKAMPRSLEEAKNFLIVANANSMDHLWLADRGFRRLMTPRTLEQSVKMFVKGRAPLIAIDDNSIAAEFSEIINDRGNFVKVMPLFNAPPFMALSNSTNDKILLKLQQAYDELLAQGEIDLVN